MLQAHRFPDIPVREAVQQIQARQKLRKKLPAWAENLSLVLPPTLSAEQASSEETAQYKACLVQGNTFADLTGGLAADTFAFSQHFKAGHYVEQQAELVEIAAYNAQQLGISRLNFHHQTAEEFLKQLPAPLDLLYLDPARRDEANRKLVRFSDCSPDVESLLPELLNKASQVLIKASPMLDLRGSLQSLGNAVAEVHCVALRHELKEILFILDKQGSERVKISTVNLATAQPSFSFWADEEPLAEVKLSAPLAYLYEPNAAIMKAAPFRLLSQQLDLYKLAPNSHLYTADELIESFPGRRYEILYQGKPDKKQLAKAGIKGKANVSTRNYPLAAEALAKKLGLSPGGRHTVFGTTSSEAKPLIIAGLLLD